MIDNIAILLTTIALLLVAVRAIYLDRQLPPFPQSDRPPPAAAAKPDDHRRRGRQP